MIHQIPQFAKGFFLGLPVWGLAGWFLNRLFGPSVNELGAKLKGWVFTRFSHDEYASYTAFTRLEKRLSVLHADGHNRFSTNKPYLNDHEIILELKKYSAKQLRDIVSIWIRYGRVWSYAASDIFFAGMELLFETLTKQHIQEIFQKHKDNNQASLWPFLELVEAKKSLLLSAEALQYLRDEQQEWSTRMQKKDDV